jgi:hypothetical protein
MGVAAEALLIAAIVAAIALALAPVYKPADIVAGTGTAAAARTTARITVPDGVYAGTTTASVNPGGSGAWAFAECRQGGTVVLRQYRDAASGQATFQLGPTPSWTGGAADCTAQEGQWDRNGRWKTLATTTFHVDG